MALKVKDDLVEVLWVKSIVYGLVILLLIVFVILAPKKVFKEETPITVAVSMAITSDDSLLLYDYEVYSTEERFNTGLIDDVNSVKLDFQERNEIVAVKIYGESNEVEIRNDYVFITSPDTPELNIEYYLVQYMEIDGINIPCRTFVSLFKDISKIVNTIYIAIVLIVSMSIFVPTTIKFTRSMVNLIIKYKSTKVL